MNVQDSTSKKNSPVGPAGSNQTNKDYMNKALCVQDSHFTPQQMDILKNTICKGVTNEEFEVFLMACVKTKLDPFMKQIYAVKRRGKKPDGTWGETMTIQTGIDGYRLIAERTECYSPGQEPTYTYDPQGKLMSATAYVKKMTKDGTWHTVSASAYIDEYCQRTKEGQPMGMWANMPRTMLAKCAESQALRKAFPAEMSGVYTKEEMTQAETEIINIAPTPETRIKTEQALEIALILEECDDQYKKWFYGYLAQKFGTQVITDLPGHLYEKMKQGATANMDANHAKQREEYQQPKEDHYEAEQLAESV